MLSEKVSEKKLYMKADMFQYHKEIAPQILWRVPVLSSRNKSVFLHLFYHENEDLKR